MKKNRLFLWLEYAAVSIIVIVFFIISYCGYFMGDDIFMNYGVSSLNDLFEHTKMFYLNLGGRLFSVASQYMFSGVLGNNRIWYVIVNTLFFVLLLMTCGQLINFNNRKEDFALGVLLFALLFWLLCPIPDHTLFWVAGSTTYLWANALSFVFLFFFLKYKDGNFNVLVKIGLCIASFFAATEFITCASICGAFVVYYAFHLKKFKGNAVPFVVGFVLGSMVLLFAPGNFIRAEKGIGIHSLFDVQYLLHHPFEEMSKYKIFWLLLVVFVLGWIRNKTVVKIWVKNNSILLLSLGWSMIAFSVVFRPEPRALFFTETLSLVLFLKFLFDNYDIIKIGFIGEFSDRNLSIVRGVTIVLLFVIFIVDSVLAIAETNKMRKLNDVFLNEIVDSGGIVALDMKDSSHRMAYAPLFSEWDRVPLAKRYNLDSVHVYPYYCQDKYYKQGFPIENVYIDDIVVKDGLFGKSVRMIVRVENDKLQEQKKHIAFSISYTRPKKWYKSWLDKWRNYQYDRTVVVERNKPDVCFNGYSYYIIWLRKDNANNLKSVKYKVE